TGSAVRGSTAVSAAAAPAFSSVLIGLLPKSPAGCGPGVGPRYAGPVRTAARAGAVPGAPPPRPVPGAAGRPSRFAGRLGGPPGGAPGRRVLAGPVVGAADARRLRVEHRVQAAAALGVEVAQRGQRRLVQEVQADH